MTNRTKIKTRRAGDQTEILVLVNHPMETGRRIDKATNTRVAAHYIERMTIRLNGTVVADNNLGPSVAANPLIGIVVDGAKSGDNVMVKWTDNKGQGGVGEAVVG